MYCLVMLYNATKEELQPIRPLSKFVCIKAIIFFSFWQSVLITLLVWTGVIRVKSSVTTYDEKDVAAGLQDFLICIEMLFAALAHTYAFPPRVSPPLDPFACFAARIAAAVPLHLVMQCFSGRGLMICCCSGLHGPRPSHQRILYQRALHV